MKQHDLKCWPEYFAAIVKGLKRFELRLNDRDFAVGDVLCLREYIPSEKRYTGSTTRVQITYMLTGSQSINDLGSFGLSAQWVIMSIAPQY